MSGLEKAVVWLLAGGLTMGLMEGWSAVLHGRIWHGPLWRLHRSHHRPSDSAFELNDSLSVTHAPIAMALILFGCLGAPGLPREFAFGVGLGMTLFGLAYVIVHDGFIHGRLPCAWLGRFGVMRRIRNAHLIHHRQNGPPYGLFLGPMALRRRNDRRRRQ